MPPSPSNRRPIHPERRRINMRLKPKKQLSDQPPSRRSKPDPGTFMPGRMPQPLDPRISPDHRQMVRRIRPEPAVRPHHRHLAEEREQPNSLPRQLPQHLHPHCVVEPDPLPARPDQDRPSPRRLHHRRRLQLRITTTDRADIVGVINLVPNAFRQRRRHQDHPPPRQNLDRSTRQRTERPSPRPTRIDYGATGNNPGVRLHPSHPPTGGPAVRPEQSRHEPHLTTTSPYRGQQSRCREHRLELGVLRIVHGNRHGRESATAPTQKHPPA